MSKPRRIHPSYCDRCSGIFNRAPGAPDRPDNCITCGAGRHWEKRPRAADAGAESPDGDYLQPGYLLHSTWIRDLDGSFLTADELLIARHDKTGNRVDKNYGRRKTCYFRTDGTPVIRKKRNDHAVETNFLAAGGWRIRKAGTTGTPVGAPKRGVRGERLEDKLVNGVYGDWDYFFFAMRLGAQPDGTVPCDEEGVKFNRLRLRKLHEEVVRRVPGANTTALAAHLGVSARTVRTLKKAVASANSPREGGTENMSTAETIIIDRLARIERLESMRAETMDRVRTTLDELAAHFLGDERIQQAVDDFYADS